MARQCERPGCSNPADVTYGFEAAGAMVWLAPLSDEPRRRDLVGVLCRRHADALRPPRGWWLDDRRVTVPRLFTVGDDEPAAEQPIESAPSDEPAPSLGPDAETGPVARPPRKRRRRVNDDTEELAFDFVRPAEANDSVDSGPASSAGPAVPSGSSEGSVPAPATASTNAVTDPDETQAMPWTPVFDRSDDLGGVLAARSPLLSRAFGLRRAKP